MFGEGIKVSATGGMATRQPILELPCWSDSKEIRKPATQSVLFEGM